MNREYIEKERALQLLAENASDDEVFFAARAIEAEPPADVKPVVRGEWKCESRAYPDCGLWNKWRCSECGYVRTEGWKHTKNGAKPEAKYCENCGADMRKETDDERRVD